MTELFACTRCGQRKSEDQCTRKNALSQSRTCKDCHSAACYLQRLSLPQSLQQLSHEQKLDFFKNSGSLKDDKGRIALSKVKECLTKVLRSKYEAEFRDQWQGSFLPLTAWATQGFDTERIERLAGEEDREEHPAPGFNSFSGLP